MSPVPPDSVLGRLLALRRIRQETREAFRTPAAAFADWREEEHPREPDGEFAPKGEGATGTATAEAPAAAPAAPPGMPRDERLPKPGDTFARSWRGWQIKVKAHEDGFELVEGPEEHKGKKFRSLSRLATDLTGTSTNGILWFERAKKIQPKAERPAGPPGKPREPEKGPPAPEAPPPAPDAQGRLPRPNPTIHAVPTDKVQVDPERFQFKRNTSAITGAGDQFRDVEEWDPVKAGVLLLWRDRDGQLWAADGHHRIDLAKRLKAPTVNAFVLDEKDGVTHQTARATAALRNIADGKGDALDAGKAIRDMGWTVEDVKREGISPRSTLARDGLGIAGLTDSVFNLVVDDMIPQSYAAEIGRELGSSADKQRQAASAIEGARNLGEVQSVVRQVKAAPERTQAEQTLWGDEISTKSLFLERAQIETALTKRLKGDKALFRTLAGKAAKAERVEGTTVNREGSAKEAETADELALTLQTYANAHGPVKEALDDAARTYAESKRRPADVDAAVERVADALRGIDWRTGEARPVPSGDPASGAGGFFAARGSGDLGPRLEALGIHPDSVLARLAERYHARFAAAWDESKHPRGQPDNAGQFATEPAATAKKRDARIPEAGKKITRSWRGTDLEVEVGDGSFRLTKGPEHLLNKDHPSLTSLAKAITGAKAINGVVWFGLGKGEPRKKAPAVVDVEDRASPAKSSVVPPDPKVSMPERVMTPKRSKTLAEREETTRSNIQRTLTPGWEDKKISVYLDSRSESGSMRTASIPAADLDEKIQMAPLRICAPPKAIGAIFREGRFRSVYEIREHWASGEPGDKDEGNLDSYKETRLEVETGLFGHGTDDVIYGALKVPGLADGSEAFGSVEVFLRRDRTEHRTTYTNGDSFGTKATDSVARGALGRRAVVADAVKHKTLGSDYVEGQIHGGVTLDDIGWISMTPEDAKKVPGLRIPVSAHGQHPELATIHGKPVRVEFKKPDRIVLRI